MIRASIAGHSQETSDNTTDLATMSGKRKQEDLNGGSRKIGSVEIKGSIAKKRVQKIKKSLFRG
eukprot:6455139-Ditylum_brightwellii.AAC.1